MNNTEKRCPHGLTETCSGCHEYDDGGAPSKILLPRGYLSWSAWSLWKSSKKAYRKRYYENAPNIDSPELRYGSMIARLLEHDPENELVRDLPRYDVPEYSIDLKIKGVRLKGQLDTFEYRRIKFADYKTGVEPWNKLRLRKSKQFLFYAMLLRAKFGTYDEECLVHWIPTELVKTEKDDHGVEWEVHGKRIRRTGDVHSFTRFIEPWEVDMMEREMLQVAYEINLDYRNYLSNLDI